MATVTYQGESERAEWHGVSFERGKSVEVDDVVAARFAGHPLFETDAAKARVPGDDKLIAKHRGGSRFSIMRGTEEVKDGLSKEDAAAFNALSTEDKAEYVAS